MSEPFIAEVRMVGFDFAPKGWAKCDGQTMAIAQNTALFAIIGTTYGGNGTTTFNLPDLRGRVALAPGGNGITLGQPGGEATHLLLTGEMPAHTHGLRAAAAPQDNNRSLTGNYLGSSSTATTYAPGAATTTLNAATVGTLSQNQPHENMQPYLVLNYCIALVGIFPSRN